MKVYGVTGWKNAGKTGLMERLVAEITARGFSVSTVKHAHHTTDVDQPGTDSFRHRQAGAGEVLLASPNRWALMAELRDAHEPPLEALLARLSPADLVLVEGYKSAPHPKIEAHRAETGKPLLSAENNSVRAIASDAPVESPLPRFDLDDTGAIADFILADLGLVVADAPEAAPDELTPPRLRDDCFAMPQGVAWVPVDEALSRLRSVLRPVTGTETCATHAARGRVLAETAVARRSNPPRPNSAVDGYGFAHEATGEGVQRLPLVAGRAAAGQPFESAVPPGHAVRILTGAILPEGVDTVVLEEDCAVNATHVAFDGPVKPRANTRKAGEDVTEGSAARPAGHRLRAPDLALLSALGLGEVTVQRKLRVGVLSTGDEIVPSPAEPAMPHQIWDANRPMLLSLAEGWDYAPVDLGHIRDDQALIAARLDAAAKDCDVILTSGGASAGDEDHVSALLRARGTLSSWRIALKPGRPLALAMWNATPVFGLPGNPVAALVCALIFARPALSLLAGAGWTKTQGFTVPAAFSKRKKPGRREFLRARLDAEGRAEVFASEGSGRISGLSWATGLVELPDEAVEIAPGSPVRFLPYEGFGLR
ncbi:bifunctional molybdopterin-guanine dinucleotide biosynthesis adaptor protein MobB/molybdopterin molybdotransferase MoeA [uncultured Salipiger sp.]|uniref:bifunctional molybdopterin-guanine dinucleotide biosynthesis adaptor protein MobB/molybdopterin molybdotransferase MoeA n=1 Tax=uncultured Salipiger sp. TaxID=499810 RepID=UPI00259A19A6|nr:bifunctional molybdopterin-guanine dinucleotide biosynthesis adaptor protein MobB/molybdopterin molybdotransferase MoeA [uncultured Salipiger sp.]